LATVFERVRKVAIAQLGITEAEVRPETNFAEELGADSLDMVEMMISLESEFTIHGKRICIPDEESEKMLTAQDIVDYIHSIGISDTEIPKSTEKHLPRNETPNKTSSSNPQTGRYQHPNSGKSIKPQQPSQHQNSKQLPGQFGGSGRQQRNNRQGSNDGRPRDASPKQQGGQ